MSVEEGEDVLGEFLLVGDGEACSAREPVDVFVRGWVGYDFVEEAGEFYFAFLFVVVIVVCIVVVGLGSVGHYLVVVVGGR